MPSSSHAIAARIRTLIAREDEGDVLAAARRLDLPIEDVYQLERVLADERARADLLIAVVRRYDVDACWLLTGCAAVDSRQLPPSERLHVARLLSRIGNTIFAEHKRRMI